jgi:hypothetical protein
VSRNPGRRRRSRFSSGRPGSMAGGTHSPLRQASHPDNQRGVPPIFDSDSWGAPAPARLDGRKSWTSTPIGAERELATTTIGSMTVRRERPRLMTVPPTRQRRVRSAGASEAVPGCCRGIWKAHWPRLGGGARQDQQSVSRSRQVREWTSRGICAHLPRSTDGEADKTVRDSVTRVTAKINDGGIPACRYRASFDVNSAPWPDASSCSGLPQSQSGL